MPQAAERKALTEGLDKLNENMVTLSELAKLAIRKAVDSLERADAAQAQEVFTIDEEIYGLKQEITKSVVDLIALHAPVARDLRSVTASLEITTDLDRIGRYSKDIAEVTQHLEKEGRNVLTKIANLSRMGQLTIEMVDTAVDSFVHRDAEPVRNIIQKDDAVDSLHDEVFQEIIEKMGDRSLPPRVGAQFILINRYFERLADHAVNIGEHVTYMVTGQRPSRIKHPRSPLSVRTS
jgi:phosphate transport system protein